MSAQDPQSPAPSHGCCGGHDEKKPEQIPAQSGQACCHDEHDHPSAPVNSSGAAKFYCPMCPGVESDKPGACPKCGMALELNPAHQSAHKTIYTCPMHPQIEQDHPGPCPICGMALEPKTTHEVHGEENVELKLMTRRFWVGLVLTVPVLVLSMGEFVPGLRDLGFRTCP